jgi:hypothetical protein
MGGADVLDIPRPAPGRMDDLHRRRTDVVFTFRTYRGIRPTMRARPSAQPQ